MSAEAAVIAALSANAGVSALVSSRVFIKGGRQGTAYPYVTVERISTPTASHLEGGSNLDWPRFQIDAWAQDALGSAALADAIRAALDANELTGAGLTFSATFQDRRGPSADEQTRNFNVSQDFFIWHTRS